MMNTDEIIFAVIDYLNEHQLPYMLVGSLATNFYSVPRSTQDGDIVVQANPVHIARGVIAEHSNIYFDPQLGFESVTATKKVVLQTDGVEFEIEMFELGLDEHDQERFSRRKQVQTMDRLVWMASLEDMIITKLRWSQHTGREKDISDARNLIGVQLDQQVDWPYIESWCDRHGTRAILDRLRVESEST